MLELIIIKIYEKSCFIICSVNSALINADTLLHVGNLLDTNNGEISKAVTIRIKGNKILKLQGLRNTKKK